MLDNLFEYFD
jgi:V-type H+-transporting ATPase subunit H